ncbi:MAG: TonB-dependent receptor [Cyclobacteriaceae bacterium]
MRRILAVCLLLGAGGISCAQTIIILDKETDQPIELATLASSSPNAFATTNSHGEVSIAPFKPAEKIQIRSLGYETIIKSFDELVMNKEVRLEPSSFTMDEVVVSASKWSQTSGDIPVKVISISSKEATLQNPQTAADLLGISGKVFVQKSQQGGGSPMIRGFATNRLLYSVDGVRMNTAIFRGGNIQNVISLDPFAMEKTEVLFGPGSVIYGSDAIGGVMSFQTLTPQFSLDDKPLISGKVVSRFASANNEKTMHFDMNVGWKKWAMVTSISSNEFGDLKMGSHGPDDYLRPVYVGRQDSSDVVITNNNPKIQRPSSYSQMNMMQKVRFQPNTNWDFQYAFHYSVTSDYSRYDRHLRVTNGLPRYGEWYYGPQKWLMNNVSISHTKTNAAYDQMTVRIAQQQFEESRIDRSLNDSERAIRKEQVAAYSANLDLTKTLTPAYTITYGTEWVFNDVKSIGIDENIETGIRAAGPSRYPKSDWSSFGVYLNNQYQVFDALLAQVGVRYSHFKLSAVFDNTFYPFTFSNANINDGSVTGSLGFVYRPKENLVLSLNAGTAFRSPNVDDIGKVFDSEPGAVTVPNPNLKSEYAYNIDFGIAKVFNKALKIDLTAYYTILNDAMVRRDFQLGGQDSIMYDGVLSQVQAIQNAAEAHVVGIQAGLDYEIGGGFSLSSDFNWQEGKEEQDDGTRSPSQHAAPWFGVSRLKYRVVSTNLELNAQYSGKKSFSQLPIVEQGKPEIYATDTNGNPYSPGWYTLNFKASNEINNTITISAGIENITDQRYKPYSSGIAGAGRNFIISAQARF